MKLAIFSGAGQLPVLIKTAHPDAIVIGFDGMPNDLENYTQIHRFEQLGVLFHTLQDQGVTHIVMAGAMSRPAFSPDLLDEFTTAALPDLMRAMAMGDDHLLRYLIAMIEKQGFTVVGAHELLPLTRPSGYVVGQIPEGIRTDIERADAVLGALSPLDIGQGVVVENGLILGIETLQGTAALLSFVSETDTKLRATRRGVLVKRPKQGQDLRVDMPTIGPDTIDQVASAGLSGIVISPDAVVVLNERHVVERATQLGVFVIATEVTK